MHHCLNLQKIINRNKEALKALVILAEDYFKKIRVAKDTTAANNYNKPLQIHNT